MRKILNISLLLLLVMAFATATAQDDKKQEAPAPNTTDLTVASDNQTFWLYIDDVQQNKQPVKSIKVEGVSGQHEIRLKIDNENLNIVGQTIEVQNSDNTYWINQQRNMFGITLGKSVPQPEITVPLVIAEQKISAHPIKNHTETEKREHSDTDRPGKTHRSDSGNYKEFLIATHNISNANNEADRLVVAKQFAANNELIINQIVKICSMFEEENSKLDFAKYAYNHCSDRVNYSQLINIFHNESNKNEFNQFIEQQQQQNEIQDKGKGKDSVDK